MRILVLGAGGFIGRYIVAELLAQEHELVGVVRNSVKFAAAFPQITFLQFDLAKATNSQDWEGPLNGIDCIINAAGILRGSEMDAIHVAMPLALNTAASKAGTKHIVLISAISARPNVTTDYSLSKLRGEENLRRSNLNWTILRPSLVYGDGSYGGTSLMRGMAALPFCVPLPGKGDFAFTPIHVRDLAQTVVQVCGNRDYFGETLEPVGPETFSLRHLLGRYRTWLGFGPARFFSIPMSLMRLAGKVGDIIGDGPVATNSLVQMVAGNEGDSEAFAKRVGFRSIRLDDALLANPAQVQDRWHARLFFLAPAIKAVLVVLWLASAWLGMFHGEVVTRQLVAGLGLSASWGDPLRISGSLLDLGIAALLMIECRVSWITIIQLVMVLGYSVVIGFALPYLWMDPLGPLLKNLPILLLIGVYAAIGDKR
ncbi:MAG: NAD(P)H-binding protein [Novosphingobium sp.]